MGKFIDETGNRHSRLLVIRLSDFNKRGEAMWLCQCDCDNQVIVSGVSLRSRNTKSCGCLNNELKSKRQLIDETNNRYGRLVVINQADHDKRGSAMWFCQCDCGNETIVRGFSLRSGETQSCGCLQRELARNLGKLNWIPWNEHFFDNWDSNSAYILGFIIADGSIGKTKPTIEIYQKDRNALVRIATILEFDGEPHLWKKRAYTLHMTSEHAVKTLTEKYHVPRGKKSKMVRLPPYIPNEFLPHLIRGIFDGDGSISGKDYPQVAFYSKSLHLLDDISDKLLAHINMSSGYRFSHNQTGNHKIGWSARQDVIKFAHYIYNSDLDIYGSDLYLRRKKIGFDLILKRYNKLYQMYVKEGHSEQAVAKKLNISVDSVGHWIAGCNLKMERDTYWNLALGV